MLRRFSEEEINDIIRTARIQSPPFTREEYQRLILMQQEMADSKFIQAAWAVCEIEEEYGISCSEVLEKCRQLLKEKGKLEAEVKILHQKKEAATKELASSLESAKQSEQEIIRLEKELGVAIRQAKQEQNQLKKDINRASNEARISKEEIATTKELKDDIERLGLNLSLVLQLFGEFAQSKEVANVFARAVKEYGSKLEAGEKLRSENETLEKERKERQKESKELLTQCEQTRKALAQLKSELGDEVTVRSFFKRFKNSSGLLEYLAGWEQIHPIHCQFFTCGARFLVDRGPSHFRTKFVCPSCGLIHYIYDDEASIKLGLPFGTPLKVRLGE